MSGRKDQTDFATESPEDLVSAYERAVDTFQPEFTYHMCVILEEILKQITPISIYLIGSFGRKEGTFFLSKAGPRPVRDYDVLIILPKAVKNETITAVSRIINRRLGLGNFDQKNHDGTYSGFYVWITQETLLNLNSLSLLKNYELKVASTLIWGKDIRDQITVTLEDLSPYNGVLILFGKVEGLLGYLDIEEVKNRRFPHGMLNLIYECIKSYVEFGTCLCFISKIYEPSFLNRCIRVSQNFPEMFPDLNDLSSTLLSRILKCAYRRLLLTDRFLSESNIEKTLIQTAEDLQLMIWYYTRRSYRTPFSQPLDPTHYMSYQKPLNSKVLADLFGTFLKVRIGKSNRLLENIAVVLYLRYALLRFFILGRKTGLRIRLRVLFSRNSNVMLKAWLIGLTLLKSIQLGGKFDRSLLDIASKELFKIVAYKFKVKEVQNDASVFLRLQKETLGIISIADTVLHQK